MALTLLAFAEDRANPRHAAALEEADWQADRVLSIIEDQNSSSSGRNSIEERPRQQRTKFICRTLCNLSPIQRTSWSWVSGG